MATIAAGAAFGASLATSGVFQPYIIVSQLRLETWDMMQSFLTATASSALLVAAAQNSKRLNLQPRSAASLGLFSKYDGNIIGGLLLGAGMALSGACPGTVLVQVAMGTQSGFYALGGAAFAGIIWTRFLQPVLSRASASLPEDKPALYDVLGISRNAALLAFEGTCAAIVMALAYLSPSTSQRCVHPIFGGAVIGAAQLLSIVLRKALVGTSTCYVEIGNWFWWMIGKVQDGRTPGSNSMLFSAGIMSGAWVLSKAWPACVELDSAVDVEPTFAFVGGVLMTIGSRVGGGCTSGHGISGVALLSISSFVTIVSMFVSGVAVANMLY